MSNVERLINAAEKLVRVLAETARGEGRKALGEMDAIDPDLDGQGKVIAIHQSLAASNGGIDVPLNLNPEYAVAIHSVRATHEVQGGDVAGAAHHAAVKLHNADSNQSLFESVAPCAGAKGGIDLALLGSNDGRELNLRCPYIFNKAGTQTLTATFATDATWPGTRRVGVLMVATYKRRSFRQAEAV